MKLSKMAKNRLHALFAGLVFALAAMTQSPNAEAKIYKCHSTSGQTEYRRLPCAEADQQSVVRAQERNYSKRSRKAKSSKFRANVRKSASKRSNSKRRKTSRRGYTSNSMCAKAFKEIAKSRKRGSISIRGRDGRTETHRGERAARTADEAEQVFGNLCN